jgi:hypothetical protein
MQLAQGVVTVSEVPRALSPSDDSGVSYLPFKDDGEFRLLELYQRSPSVLDIGLTSLRPIERLCLLDVRDHDLVAAIEYHPGGRP